MRRIKYLSSFARPIESEEIEELVEKASQNNTALGITGVLMATGGIFFQIIEGGDDAIVQLFERIQQDERHNQILMLRDEKGVESRLFPDWGMRRYDPGPSAHLRHVASLSMLESIVEMQSIVKRLTLSLEQSIWLELNRSVQ